MTRVEVKIKLIRILKILLFTKRTARNKIMNFLFKLFIILYCFTNTCLFIMLSTNNPIHSHTIPIEFLK